MITETKHFFKIILAACVLAVAVGADLPAVAATGNGCDDEDVNEYVTPMLAMCTTHAYNVGAVQNPSDSSGRDIMTEVVALKTTLIAQQMYAQYEVLKNTVSRMKTQLKKEVLLTQLKAAHGDSDASDDSGGGYGSSRRNGGSAFGDSCYSASDPSDAVRCIQNHFSRMRNSKDLNAIRKQLQEDYNIMSGWFKPDTGEYAGTAKKVSCSDFTGLKANKVDECLDALSSEMNQGLYKLKQENNKGWGFYGPNGG